MPKVSVIIPCYNHGDFLDEAVASVRAQSYPDLEIIIVNDGSTDELTNSKCDSYEGSQATVITTVNQGLAAARNTGIDAASGEYILPLDADDRIGPDYLSEAVRVLDGEKKTGIVYSRARLFGAVETEWSLPEYSLEEMLKDNVIFCSALFRKADWQLVGGYDPGMIYGWEDYDFWLCLIERGRQVRQLPGYHFFYRVAPDSMVRSKEKWQKIEMFKRIYRRHSELIGEHIETWLAELIEMRERYHTARLYVDCGRGVSDADSITRKIEPGTKIIIFDLDGFKECAALRFDPVECPVCLELHAVTLFSKKEEESLDLSELSSNALYRQENFFMFDSNDPNIFLNLPESVLGVVSKVIITIEYRFFEDKALHEIIDFQKTQITRHRKRLILPKWLKPC